MLELSEFCRRRAKHLSFKHKFPTNMRSDLDFAFFSPLFLNVIKGELIKRDLD